MNHESEIIIVNKRTVVNEHPESKAKYITYPFAFPDGSPGIITIVKGKKTDWIPSKDLKKIELTFTDA